MDRPDIAALKRVLCVVTLCAAAPACGGPPRKAAAELMNARGQPVGKVLLEEVKDGVRVRILVHGLTPGLHGMHIHETGRCEPPDFQSAGDHFNPFGGVHGKHHEHEGHAGDMPNLNVSADGTGRVEFLAEGVNLRRSGHHSLLRGDGTSVVIHAREDDMKTALSGNAGERVACGVVVLQPPAGA